MKIQQMILVNPEATGDKQNDLAFIILKNNNMSRWSNINNGISYRIYPSYSEAFDFKEIYVTETPEQNNLD